MSGALWALTAGGLASRTRPLRGYSCVASLRVSNGPKAPPLIALGAAIEYLDGIGLERAAAYEAELLAYATEQVAALPGVRLIGTAPEKIAVLSFVLDGIHAHDVGAILDQGGIAVRTGHHCAQPVMDRYGVPATVRASVAFYNTYREIDALVAGLRDVQEIFA